MMTLCKLSVVAVVLAASPAFASYSDTIAMQFQGIGLGQNVQLTVGTSTFNTFAGELIFRSSPASTGDGSLFANLTLPTFCIEPTQGVQSGLQTYGITASPADTSGVFQSGLPMLSASQTSAIENAMTLLVSHRSGGTLTNDIAAGFQLALWDIVVDYNDSAGRSSLSLTAGSFLARSMNGSALSSSISSWANAFFDSIGPNSVRTISYGFDNASSQNQVIPSSSAAGLALIAALAVSARRRR